MKTITNLFYPVILVCIILSSSCSDNEDGIYTDPNAKLLPIKISYSKSNRSYYTYDASNRLIEILSSYKFDNEFVGSYSFLYEIKYTADNKVDSLYKTMGPYQTRTTYVPNDTIGFDYDGLKITATSKFSVLEMTIDEQGQVLTASLKPTILSGGLSWERLYEYDSTGNISRCTLKYSTGETYVINYTYDNRNGIFKNVNTPQWLLVTQLDENCIINNEIYENGNMNTNISYKYSASGYPKSYTVRYIDNTKITYTIDYKDIQ